MTTKKKAINETIGANIQMAREHAGITQEKLSERIGMGVKSLSAIERGAVGISLSALKRVCEKLLVTSDSLIFGIQKDGEREEEILGISEQLRHLSQEEFNIARDILIRVLEAMRISTHGKPGV